VDFEKRKSNNTYSATELCRKLTRDLFDGIREKEYDDWREYDTFDLKCFYGNYSEKCVGPQEVN
jgi:hypothetical protein